MGDTDLRASLTSQNPVDESTGDTLARRAKTMASLGVSQSIAALRVGGVLRYVGESRDTYTDPITNSTVTTQLRSFTVLDLTASYRYSPTVALTARLDNVSDESYQTVYGYNQQPRSLYAGITWTPKR
jgi:vitamin B12 transporter